MALKREPLLPLPTPPPTLPRDIHEAVWAVMQASVRSYEMAAKTWGNEENVRADAIQGAQELGQAEVYLNAAINVWAQAEEAQHAD